MLTLTAAQMKVLSESAMERLIDGAVEHVRTSLPEVYEQMGPSDVRDSVLLAMSKAERYGLERWSDVVRYLNVMFILGFEFDDDPRYPWAQEALAASDVTDDEKMNLVTDKAIQESVAAHASPTE